MRRGYWFWKNEVSPTPSKCYGRARHSGFLTSLGPAWYLIWAVDSYKCNGRWTIHTLPISKRLFQTQTVGPGRKSMFVRMRANNISSWREFYYLVSLGFPHFVKNQNRGREEIVRKRAWQWGQKLSQRVYVWLISPWLEGTECFGGRVWKPGSCLLYLERGDSWGWVGCSCACVCAFFARWTKVWGLRIPDQCLLASQLLRANSVAVLWLLLLPHRKSQNKLWFVRFVKIPQVGFNAHLISPSYWRLRLLRARWNTLRIWTGRSRVASAWFLGSRVELWLFLCQGHCGADRTRTATVLIAYLVVSLWISCGQRQRCNYSGGFPFVHVCFFVVK